MATTAKVILKAEDQISSGVKSATKSLEGMGGAASRLGTALRGAFTVGATVAAIRSLASAAAECVKEFAETEKAVTRLSSVLKATDNSIGMSVDELRGLASSLSNVTTFSDETILGVQQLLITTQKVSKEVLPQATEAALDMATALGQDATTAAERLAQALESPAEEIEALREAQIYLDDTQIKNIETLIEQNRLYEAQQVILQEIEETYGGIARAVGSTDTGKLQKLQNAWQDLKSSLGELIMQSLGKTVDFIIDQMQRASDKVDEATENLYNAELAQNTLRAGQTNLADYSDAQLDKVIDTSVFGRWLTGQRLVLGEDPNDFAISEALKSLEFTYKDMAVYQAAVEEKAVREAIQEGIYEFQHTRVNLPFDEQSEFITQTLNELNDAIWNSYNDPEQQRVLRGIQSAVQGYLPKIADEETESTQPPITVEVDDSLAKMANDALRVVTDNLFNKTYDQLSGSYDTIRNSLETLDSLSDSDLKKLDIGAVNEQLNSALRETSEQLAIVNNDYSNLTDSQKRQYDGLGSSLVKLDEEVEKTTSSLQVTQNQLIAFDFIGGLEANIENALMGLFDNMAQSGGAIGVLGSAFGLGIGKLLDTVSPLLDLVDSVINPLSIINTILQGFVTILEPFVENAVEPLISAFTTIGEVLGSLFIPIIQSLAGSMEFIGGILTTVITPVLQLMSPVLEIIAVILEILKPIIQTVAVVFEVLAAPVRFVADLFNWLGDWISYLGDCIAVVIRNIGKALTFQWGSFESFDKSPGGFSSDAFSGLQDRIDNIWNAGGSSSSVPDQSTDTSIGSASYKGPTSVTINIYQQAPVVGDGGMSEFARILRREFEELNYYGVTT